MYRTEDIIEVYLTYDGIVVISRDNFCENPRTFYESLTEMYLWNKEYISPDKISQTFDEFYKTFNKNKNIYKGLRTDKDGFLYLEDDFDKNSEGIIFINKDNYRQEFNIKKITKEHLSKIEKNFFNVDIEIYNNFVEGEVFSFEKYDFCNNTKIIDSGIGFYGDDFIYNGLYNVAGDKIKKLSKEEFDKFFYENLSILDYNMFESLIKLYYNYVEDEDIIEIFFEKINRYEIFSKNNFCEEFLDFLDTNNLKEEKLNIKKYLKKELT